MNWKLLAGLTVMLALSTQSVSWSAEESTGSQTQPSPPPGQSYFQTQSGQAGHLHDFMLAQSDTYDSAVGQYRRGARMKLNRGARFDEGRRKHLEQFRTLRLLELLDLGEDQEIEFLTAFRSIRRTHKELDEEKRALLEKLSEDLAAGGVDESMMEEALEGYFRIEERRRQVHMQFLDKMKNLLEPAQLGKFLLFQERFEKQLLEKVKGFHNRPGFPRSEG